MGDLVDKVDNFYHSVNRVWFFSTIQTNSKIALDNIVTNLIHEEFLKA